MPTLSFMLFPAFSEINEQTPIICWCFVWASFNPIFCLHVFWTLFRLMGGRIPPEHHFLITLSKWPFALVFHYFYLSSILNKAEIQHFLHSRSCSSAWKYIVKLHCSYSSRAILCYHSMFGPGIKCMESFFLAVK